jgi:hypothetical protein
VNSLVCVKVQRKLGVKALNNDSRRALDGLCADSSLLKKRKEEGRKKGKNRLENKNSLALKKINHIFKINEKIECMKLKD